MVLRPQQIRGLSETLRSYDTDDLEVAISIVPAIDYTRLSYTALYDLYVGLFFAFTGVQKFANRRRLVTDEQMDLYQRVSTELETIEWAFKERTRAIINHKHSGRKGLKLRKKAIKLAKDFKWNDLLPKPEFPKPIVCKP
jgi:hypothetical protein